MTEGTAEFLIRPARDSDLDVIAGFEIDIARASFGDEAIEDAALHRKRVAAALGKLRGFQRPGQLRDRVGDHHAQAAAARAAAGDLGQPGSRFRLPGQAGAALRGQPHRAGPVHHAALAQLVADGGDDRNRQLGSPADLARRDRLVAGDHPEYVGNAGRPLRQPDRGGDLRGYCVNVHA